jgi:hypothetical protein
LTRNAVWMSHLLVPSTDAGEKFSISNPECPHLHSVDHWHLYALFVLSTDKMTTRYDREPKCKTLEDTLVF